MPRREKRAAPRRE
uniref:Uncharacterized protein n=1 Tax=Arundo donax TaxID=35708 RepID=A0A0A9HSL0_ARUDO